MKTRTPKERAERKKVKTARAKMLGKEVSQPKPKQTNAADKKACIKRDGKCCIRCGEPTVDLHHIRTVGAAPELRHEPNNHCLLCRLCHTWAHENPSDFKRWFISVRPEQARAINLEAFTK